MMPQASVAMTMQSRSTTPEFMRRLQWRCRRGLLELDIVLARFVATRYAQLDDAQKIAFDELLDLPDTVLWDMMTEKQAPDNKTQHAVLESLKAA